jgi:hypothetical protein
MTVGMSSGETERRSITSSSMPSSAAVVAAWSSVETVGPYPTAVTWLPGRMIRARYSGSGDSLISALAAC